MSTKIETKYSTLIRPAAVAAFKKLDPRDQIKNLVMFVVYIGAILSTGVLFQECSGFNVQICIWLWFTCLFANFAEAMAEGRGKAHADELRKMRTTTMARKLTNNTETKVPSAALKIGDLFVCETGMRFRRTVKLLMALPRSMNRRSPVNLRLWSAKAVATAVL